MSKFRPDRLLKHADFLDKLPAERFDFATIRERSSNSCGTVACGIGWLPESFTRSFKATSYAHTELSDIFLKRDENVCNFNAAAEFFGLEYGEVRALFRPDYQSYERFGIVSLPDSATAKQLAKNMRKFVKWKLGAEKRKVATQAKLAAITAKLTKAEERANKLRAEYEKAINDALT